MPTPTPCFFKAALPSFNLQTFKERLALKLSDLCELIELKFGPEASERCLFLTLKDSALKESYEVEILFQPELEEEAYIALIRDRISDINDDESIKGPFSDIESESETESTHCSFRPIKK